MLHCQQVVAGSDAGAAVHDGLFRIAALKQALEVRAQRLGRQVRALVGQIVFEEVIDRCRDVTRYAIDRLDTALVSFRRTGIDQHTRALVR